MSTATIAPAATTPHRTPSRAPALAVLLFAQTAIFLIPMIVLGSAIGWPASLSFPAAQVLPTIHANAGAVLLGYWAYLIVSVAMIPLVFAFRAWAMDRGVSGWALDALTFAGAAAGVLKTLGIVRWLTVMPMLAREYVAADATQRASIELTYRAFNAYAGSVGELLGVQLMSGLWLMGAGVVLVMMAWRLIGSLAVLAGALFLATCLRTALPEMAVLQTVAVPLTLVWFVLAGIAVARR
jgi:hypothetical protein